MSVSKIPVATIAAQNTKLYCEESEALRKATLAVYEDMASELTKIICDAVIDHSRTSVVPSESFPIFTRENYQKIKGLSELDIRQRRDMVDALQTMLREEKFVVSPMYINSEFSINVSWSAETKKMYS